MTLRERAQTYLNDIIEERKDTLLKVFRAELASQYQIDTPEDLDIPRWTEDGITFTTLGYRDSSLGSELEVWIKDCCFDDTHMETISSFMALAEWLDRVKFKHERMALSAENSSDLGQAELPVQQ